MAGLMTIKAMGTAGGAALAGGATGAALTAAAGAPALAAGLAGLAAAGCAVATVRLLGAQSRQIALSQELSALQDELTFLGEQQAQTLAKMAVIERRTIESPALVWRAAAADIEVLGSLVSDLAKSVAEHETRLGALGLGAVGLGAIGFGTPAFAQQTAPATAPDWYEDEAELGFTADVPLPAEKLPASASAAPSPAVIAELKSTLAAALTSDRLELCLQPMVALPQRKTRGYEATLRLKGEQDDLQSDADLRRIAAATHLEAEYDRVLVDRAVHVLRILRARERDVLLTCSISGTTLGNAPFLEMLERLLRQDTGLGSGLMLDISDADLRALPEAARDAMTGLSAKGIRFGLSRLPHLRLDMAEMAARGIRQVRISAQTLIEAGQNSETGQDNETGFDIHPADLAEFLQRRGIDLLVGQIASEQTILDLLDFSIPLAIGPLFGASRPVRPEILEPKAVEAPVDRATAMKRAAEASRAATDPAATPQRGQRQSFRSLLRRA